MQNIVVAEKKFSVPSSAERVWRLLGKVIFSSLPQMENIEILDENNFRAILKTKILGAELNLKVKGEVVDIEPPENLTVRLSLSGPGIFSEIDQRVCFKITAEGKEKAGVECKAILEKIGRLSRFLLGGEIKEFAEGTFAAIEKRLQELV
ncbi:MAG: SRPBCC domain-containing protein [Thermodesulfobacteriota bacterium]